MKKIKKTVALLTVIALMITACGCTTLDNFKNTFMPEDPSDSEVHSTIKIGVYEPLTGAYGKMGREEVKGIELAHDMFSVVCGKKVELIYADNKSDIDEAETAIAELMTHSPSIVLGSYGETLTLVAGDYIKEAGIPAITISSTNPLITANNEYYFSASYTATKQGAALAEFAADQQKFSAAVVKVERDDFATETARQFTEKMKEVAHDTACVKGVFQVQKDAADYSDVINKIEESGAQAVFLTLGKLEMGRFLAQVYNEKKLEDVLFLGTDVWNDEDFLKLIYSVRDLDIAYCTSEADEKQTPMAKRFLDAYHAKYGEDEEPSGLTALAFDAYLIALQAIYDTYTETGETEIEAAVRDAESDAEGRAIREEIAQSIKKEIPVGSLIKKQLNTLSGFAGATGIISYDGGNEANSTITVNHIVNGEAAGMFMSK